MLVLTNLRAINQTTASRPHTLGNITFGGISYDHALNEGKTVRLHSNKTTRIEKGVLTVNIPDSSAVLLAY
jgi:hypothetical protein